MPQHSFGASSRACATISSISGRAIRTPLRLVDPPARLGRLGIGVGLELRCLGLVAVTPDARERLLELAQPTADRARRLRQPLGAEHDERYREDEQDLQRSDVAD